MGMEKERMAHDFAKVARTSPERAATVILKGVAGNRYRILVGVDARFFDAVPRVMGTRYTGIAARGARVIGPRLGLDLVGDLSVKAKDIVDH